MRRFAASICEALAFPVATASTTRYARRRIVFSEESPALVAAAAELGWGNVWAEERELAFLKAASRPEAVATMVVVKRRFEFYNIEALEPHESFEGVPPVSEHTDMSTGRAFQPSLAKALQSQAAAAGWQSKHWFAKKVVRREGFRYKPFPLGARPSVTLFLDSTVRVFNAAQLVEPAAVAALPLSGGTKLALPESVRPLFRAAMEANGWPTGLFFTVPQMQGLGLAPLVGAVPVELPGKGFVRPQYVYWNVTQLNDPDTAMAKLGRVGNPRVPTSLITGDAIGGRLLATQLANARFPSNFWVKQDTLRAHGLSVRLGQHGHAVYQSLTGLQRELPAGKYYNAAQLQCPERAFAVAGTFVQRASNRMDQGSGNRGGGDDKDEPRCEDTQADE